MTDGARQDFADMGFVFAFVTFGAGTARQERRSEKKCSQESEGYPCRE